jgi:hypothetical protein
MNCCVSSFLGLLLLSLFTARAANGQVLLRPGDVSMVEELLVQHDAKHLMNRPHVVICLRHGSCKGCIDSVESLLRKSRLPVVVSVCASSASRAFGASLDNHVRIIDNECVANKLSVAQPLSSLLIYSKRSGYTWYPIEPASLKNISMSLSKKQR